MVTEGANFRVIAGRYRLEGEIGRGGMGVVWRATDQLLGRQVAVKEVVIDPSLPERDARRQRERTLREARAVAQLSHPNIVVVHDVVEDDTHPYIVMELIDGGSLEDRIAAYGPVDAHEAARIGIGLLGALRKAHDSGVLHRDLKPANVLFEEGTDRVVLTDFGIAQLPGSTTLTETGSFVGSPEYTAPERMSGARTGPKSDLWSLGALLCAALSGASPFRRDSLGGVLHAVVVDEIRPPAQAAPLLPVVLGLLERDPHLRLDAVEAERLLRIYRETGRMPQAVPGHLPGSLPGHLPEHLSGHRPGHRPGLRPGLRPGHPPVRLQKRRLPFQGARDAGSASGGAGEAGAGGESGPTPGNEAGTGTGTGSFGLRGAGWSGRGGGGSGRISWKAVVIAAALVAAMAGAGVSAVALLIREGGSGEGPPSPSSTEPRTPSGTTGTPSPPGTPSPGRAPTPTVTGSPTTAAAFGPVLGAPEGTVTGGNVSHRHP
ncbi:protein kinase domain-containing protein [Streptomyces sp. CRN 30]|uniref:protein kinase domain-containing protein n=1 Tax=Streptomyces sp. CRN 30 TaxID=3075613 RepID=UPI0039C01443